MKGGFARKRKLGKALSGGLLSQLLEGTGNTISNADRARLQAMMGSAGAGAGAAAALGGSGNSISNADMARIQELLGSMTSPQPKTDRQLMQFEDGGKVKKPKKYTGPLPKPKPKMTPIEKFTGKRSVNKSLSEEEKKYIGDKMAGKVVEKMKKGGAAVPSEFKGFSKLPEAVQVKMDPVAAKKYNGGGEVRGMGRAYMGASRKAKIR
jgi:hypothetical protein